MTQKINLGRDDLMDAVSDGVRRAIWQIATNATDAPCADFYDAIQKGASKAMFDLAGKKETK